MKLIIDIEKDYYEILKYNVEHEQNYKPWNIIANGIPYEERPQGKWYKTGQSFVNPNRFRNYGCSNCRFELNEHIRREPNFCPNCGADMRGNEE